jgi:transposase
MKQSKPKLEYRNRGQVYLGVVDLDKLIEAGHAARAVWALLEGMDFSRWEEQIRSREGEAGRSAVPPRLLAALWIYGYSLGVGSARALERMQSYEPGLRWLCADEPVNHHTLSDFRVRYEEALDGLFSQVLAVLEQGGLVDLGTVVVDGTKVRAASGAGSLHRRATLEKSLRQAEEVVEALKRETGEAGGEERRRAAAERAARERVERMQAGLRELERRQEANRGREARVSTSEPEVRKMRMADGLYAPAWNLQLATETAGNVVVGVEVTGQGSDAEQLPGMVEQIERRLGRAPERMLADGGYTSRRNVEYAHRAGIELYAPWETDAVRHRGALVRNGIAEAFGPQAFVYDARQDVLICPAGERLERGRSRWKNGARKVRYEAAAEACAACPHRPQCCGRAQGRGRWVERTEQSEAMQAYLDRMASPEGRQFYRQRSRYGEFPQLQIKGVLHLRRFHVRGRRKFRQEGMLWALAYNVMQWIRLVWRKLESPPPALAAAAC